MTQILVSKLLCTDGTVLHSRHRHDYQEHTDTITGQWMMLDGGQSYIRHSGNGELLTITTDDEHSLIREHLDWGSRGKDGNSPLTYITLKNIDDDHLLAIFRTQTHLPGYLLNVFAAEISFRGLA